MNILSMDKKQGFVKVKITDSEDLFYLEQVIQENDLVSGSSERKIKIGEEPNVKVVRKKFFLKISVEKKEYDPGRVLRVSGKVVEGPEEVTTGSYHTFNLEEGEVVNIEKEWSDYDLNKLEESTRKKSTALLVVFDREQANFAELKNNTYNLLTGIKGNVQKKQYNTKESDFYKEIVKVIEEYDSNNSYDNIIIASPSFWKEYLVEKIPSSLKKKISLASVSDSSENSFNELLKRDELDKALKDYKVSNELVEVEKVLEAISKDLACYGFDDCKEKINLGSVKKLVVSDNFFKKMKLDNKYKELETLIKTCEKMQTEVLICSGKESMEKVDGLGGICGILRWKV